MVGSDCFGQESPSAGSWPHRLVDITMNCGRD
jgi:hypothetical protein